ncbi:hypothetical protein [Mycobacterium asiaticum]|uniref:Transmembrane protein n=1 Tax=Mycobacterium asiaticum TaxID=1790 RepID=A0A1A3UVT2_MYCAS|nr:hypothetical protein [Mycobacterium asiaticum]OBK26210.1 hypothetical protein A5635_13665 [Mycobacterium asiaticum]OBK98602.1 hypothetical protein A5645_02390 [Mycobacterium asiaticum]
MGRKVAMLWHASFSIGAGVLFFYFVLPRWPELVGDTPEMLGRVLRIVTGALIGLAALPVVFTQRRTGKPELGTPQMALTIRTCSIVAHVLAGVLIVGTAISEFWFKLDTAGQWLFAIYGAAAAIAVLGFFAFYLSFVAELPPPPPKPIKPKKVKKSRGRAKKRGKADEVDAADDEDEDEATEEAEDDADDEDEEGSEDTVEAQDAEDEESTQAETVEAKVPEPVTAAQEAEETPAETTEETADTSEAETSETDTVEAPVQQRLRNRRPTGKTSHRRRRTRGGVAVEE